MKYQHGDQIVEAIQWDGTLESLNPLLTCGRWPSLAVRVDPGGVLVLPMHNGVSDVATPGNWITYQASTKHFDVVPSLTFHNDFHAVTE